MLKVMPLSLVTRVRIVSSPLMCTPVQGRSSTGRWRGGQESSFWRPICTPAGPAPRRASKYSCREGAAPHSRGQAVTRWPAGCPPLRYVFTSGMPLPAARGSTKLHVMVGSGEGEKSATAVVANSG